MLRSASPGCRTKVGRTPRGIAERLRSAQEGRLVRKRLRDARVSPGHEQVVLVDGPCGELVARRCLHVAYDDVERLAERPRRRGVADPARNARREKGDLELYVARDLCGGKDDDLVLADPPQHGTAEEKWPFIDRSGQRHRAPPSRIGPTALRARRHSCSGPERSPPRGSLTPSPAEGPRTADRGVGVTGLSPRVKAGIRARSLRWSRPRGGGGALRAQSAVDRRPAGRRPAGSRSSRSHGRGR